MTFSKHIWGHKYLELEFLNLKIQNTACWVEFHIGLSTQRDHAGFEINTSIFGFWARFQIYDNRHWDHENKKWMDYV
jgi:hypothetical protein